MKQYIIFFLLLLFTAGCQKDLLIRKTKDREDGTIGNPKQICEKNGGIWLGTVMGRGRITGCNMPTKDKDKECSSSDECESVCLQDTASSKKGKCYGWSKYKGCGIIADDGRVLCID